MSHSKAYSRYAKALFSCSFSEEEKKMQATILHLLSKEMKDHPHVALFFQNPLVSLEEKKNLLKNALGKGASSQFLLFLEILIKGKRFQDLSSVSYAFENLLNEQRKASEALLIFAEPMDSKTQNFFKEKLETLFKKKITIKEKIDPSILGGFILIIDGKIMDSSIKGKLSRLKERFIPK